MTPGKYANQEDVGTPREKLQIEKPINVTSAEVRRSNNPAEYGADRLHSVNPANGWVHLDCNYRNIFNFCVRLFFATVKGKNKLAGFTRIFTDSVNKRHCIYLLQRSYNYTT